MPRDTLEATLLLFSDFAVEGLGSRFLLDSGFGVSGLGFIGLGLGYREPGESFRLRSLVLLVFL